jgi:hypothetical protein
VKKIMILLALPLFSNACLGKHWDGIYWTGDDSVQHGATSGCTVEKCIHCETSAGSCPSWATSSTASSGDTLNKYILCTSTSSTSYTCCNKMWKSTASLCTACASSSGYSDVSGQNYQSESYGGTCSGGVCNGSAGTCSNRSVRYRCKSGYYGTSTSCTVCPANASCPAGSTTFSCNSGYYKNGTAATSCTACPANASCPAGSTAFSCNEGYYQSGTSCAGCQVPSDIKTTAGASLALGSQIKTGGGATAQASCYIISGTYKDDNGQFDISGKCAY